jgi:putative transcriptional regulator
VSLANQLLVAVPPLEDPNFDSTVLVLLQHGPEGAFGVILNRPSRTRVADALPGWERLVTEPPVLFHGGPVGDATGVCVAVSPDASMEILDLNVDPDGVVLDGRQLRIFTGFAGWGAGQLEQELAAGCWVVAAADVFGDVVGPDPEALWRRVLRRQGGRTAWLANLPRDPSRN